MMQRIHFLIVMTAEVPSFGASEVSGISQCPDIAGELQWCLLMTTLSFLNIMWCGRPSWQWSLQALLSGPLEGPINFLVCT